MQYPYSRQLITEDDACRVLEALNRTMITQGALVEDFENALASTLGAKFAIVCNSGTAALHMVYSSLGLGPKAGLITSSITFLATANAARMCGAPVGFADVDPTTGNATLAGIRAAVEAANFPVKAIAVVHLGGRPCAMPEIKSYADSIGAVVVEDACHAPLAKYTDLDGHVYTVGSCAHSVAATLSFHAIKHITTGEGGVVLTNDKELANAAKLFRSHGIVRNKEEIKNQEEAGNPWYYEMLNLGYNYRLSDINCALGLSQLSRLEKNIQRRNAIAVEYHKHLTNLGCVNLPHLLNDNEGRHAWHLFSPRFDFPAIGLSRQDLMRKLAYHGVGSQVHYIPLYRHPYYAAEYDSEEFFGAEAYYKSTLSLPIYIGLTDDDVEKIGTILCAVTK